MGTFRRSVQDLVACASVVVIGCGPEVDSVDPAPKEPSDCDVTVRSECIHRRAAIGYCMKSTGDACMRDGDCVAGGCGGELCYAPDAGDRLSTCECVAPTGVGCGCVDGGCAWFD